MLPTGENRSTRGKKIIAVPIRQPKTSHGLDPRLRPSHLSDWLIQIRNACCEIGMNFYLLFTWPSYSWLYNITGRVWWTGSVRMEAVVGYSTHPYQHLQWASRQNRTGSLRVTTRTLKPPACSTSGTNRLRRCEGRKERTKERSPLNARF
jgi:hypothetical protein